MVGSLILAKQLLLINHITKPIHRHKKMACLLQDFAFSQKMEVPVPYAWH